jgi:type III restriction enzyme
MANLRLFDFQQAAVDQLTISTLSYFYRAPDRHAGRDVPFVGQLKAVTGAGKTPILASVVARMSPAIVLWTTKYGSVVDQTVTNLRPGGKYHHLLDGGRIDIIRFSDIGSPAEWRDVLEREDGLTIVVSTVAAWNDTEKDERLNVHRLSEDWGSKSRWDQLRTERRQRLWVVYDEAHNTTSDQVELLDDLDPTGFFVASASQLRGSLQQYLTWLPEDQRRERIATVSTRAVVDAQLLKSTISVGDYDSSPEEMLAAVVERRARLEQGLAAFGSPVTPKAIYVVETSNTSAGGGEPRPVQIWKTLVNTCCILPAHIAICTNTKAKDLPRDAIRITSIDQLTDQFTHIIFNKKLQEGWDDPSVYTCYFDGQTDSATRIQQVLGRALRQPNATHLSDEDLNTAYFFVNCPNDRLEKIIDGLKEELRIYKADDDLDDFEPFQIKEERKALAKIPLKPEFVEQLKVPKLQLELPSNKVLRKLIEDKTYEFSDGDRKAPGRALVKNVSVRTGEETQKVRDLYEDMRVRCGLYLQEQIRIRSKNCANSLHPSAFSNEQLDKTACYSSKALKHYQQLAAEVVAAYENRVQLGQLVDPFDNEYTVGAYQPSGEVEKAFCHAGHPYYDTKSFNDDELRMAKALDQFEHVWVRNRDRIGYGIPLPMKSGSSSIFYPDFLWWVDKTLWAIDPTGKFILEEKIRTKLLIVPAPLKIALVTPGRFDGNKKLSEDGLTLVRHRYGSSSAETFNNLEDLLATLVAES